ncbi:sodium:solute symporter family transporter [Salinibacter altiplanensis]|uniref:sodium:solute symporter family transporter n=1 Tax=Salinibacter altiplanensis TaxID=1803181 RepID=UPI00131A4B97|nr:sodium:solute symporter [Salinibacter altiplanensis]
MLLALIVGAGLFAAVGLGYVLWTGAGQSLEDYVTARGQFGTTATTATLFASAMGSWILFGPPEAATWGGLPAIVGYALGSALPPLLYIPLGQRLRTLMPEGHSLTEFVRHRYGRAMHVFTLGIMTFYLFIALTAQVTGMAFILQLVADVPLWITAGIVLVATVAYTAVGGLRASIVTDGVQSLLLLPLLAGGAVAAVAAVGGTSPLVTGVADRAPELLRWTHPPGVKGGLALVIGIAAASLFNQGTWQRVYAADSMAALRVSFATVAGTMAITVLGTGLLGLAAVGKGVADPPSTALFGLLLDAAPSGGGLGLVFLGLVLVMSSADTVLNALASLVAVDLRQAVPTVSAGTLMQVARWATAALAVPVFGIAAQGISVLYLFLVADLVCAAAVAPVFGGLLSGRLTNWAAVLATGAGLVLGGVLFPAPGASQPDLLPAFATALVVPTLVMGTSLPLAPHDAFDLSTLQAKVTTIDE